MVSRATPESLNPFGEDSCRMGVPCVGEYTYLFIIVTKHENGGLVTIIKIQLLRRVSLAANYLAVTRPCMFPK